MLRTRRGVNMLVEYYSVYVILRDENTHSDVILLRRRYYHYNNIYTYVYLCIPIYTYVYIYIITYIKYIKYKYGEKGSIALTMSILNQLSLYYFKYLFCIQITHVSLTALRLVLLLNESGLIIY